MAVNKKGRVQQEGKLKKARYKERRKTMYKIEESKNSCLNPFKEN